MNKELPEKISNLKIGDYDGLFKIAAENGDEVKMAILRAIKISTEMENVDFYLAHISDEFKEVREKIREFKKEELEQEEKVNNVANDSEGEINRKKRIEGLKEELEKRRKERDEYLEIRRNRWKETHGKTIIMQNKLDEEVNRSLAGDWDVKWHEDQCLKAEAALHKAEEELEIKTEIQAASEKVVETNQEAELPKEKTKEPEVRKKKEKKVRKHQATKTEKEFLEKVESGVQEAVKYIAGSHEIWSVIKDLPIGEALERKITPKTKSKLKLLAKITEKENIEKGMTVFRCIVDILKKRKSESTVLEKAV
jgi:hypothetical protein